MLIKKPPLEPFIIQPKFHLIPTNIYIFYFFSNTHLPSEQITATI